MEYRLARESDAEAVARLHAQSWRESYRGSFIDNLHPSRASKRGGIGSSLMRQAGTWLDGRYPDLGVYLWVLEANSSARQFYERLGAHDAGISVMETHGGAVVRSCRYVWSQAGLLAAGQRPGEQ
jgi:GNAT superfamily N-acetyltransferase